MREQSRRHAYLLHLLGIRQTILAVNKIDRVGHDAARIRSVAGAMEAYLDEFGAPPRHVIPLSARDGDNVARRSARTPWYDGPTLLEALDRFEAAQPLAELPLRLPVQDVYKFDERRLLVGRIETGTLRSGDELLFSPSNKTARVAALAAWPEDGPVAARAGESVGLTLDAPLFVERGEIASHVARAPLESDVFRARLFWLDRDPLRVGARYRLKLNTTDVGVTVQAIETVIDTDDLGGRAAGNVGQNAVAEVVLRADRLVALDPFADNPRTGRFVLAADFRIVGGGILNLDGYADQRSLVEVRATNISMEADAVGSSQRRRRNRHRGGVIWFTGLSGAGKSTIAQAVEAALFARGCQTYVLDGDNVRAGLNANLGFSPEDRAENIRRVGEVAALFADAGILVITAFISPYRSDRERARRATARLLDADAFQEIHIHADLATCEVRDPKGLYKRARRGEIPDFTGIAAPYEAPESPDLFIDTVTRSVAGSVERILHHVTRHFTVVE